LGSFCKPQISAVFRNFLGRIYSEHIEIMACILDTFTAPLPHAFLDQISASDEGRAVDPWRLFRVSAWWQTDPGQPPGNEKTAGRAATLASGHFNSASAIFNQYNITDSRASAVLAGGAS